LYVGMTDDLIRRIWEHKNKVVPGFTAKYGVDRLVWFEAHETREGAWEREKQIKEWRRAWKIQIVEENNRTGLICTPASRLSTDRRTI